MAHYPPTLVRLIQSLSKLPGIGEKSAERLAMHILRLPETQARQLAENILATRQDMGLCSRCFGLADADVCHICSNPARDISVLCVVEQAPDMVALEKSGAFSGRYHVLQGALSPIDGVGPDKLRIKELVARIHGERIREVVIATSTSTEGEATADYLAQVLGRQQVKVTRIATGVPMGGDLKFVDGLTLKRAIQDRRRMQKA